MFRVVTVTTSFAHLPTVAFIVVGVIITLLRLALSFIYTITLTQITTWRVSPLDHQVCDFEEKKNLSSSASCQTWSFRSRLRSS